MAKKNSNAADRIVRTRLHETTRFPDLTERGAIHLASVLHYTARSHFAPWRKILGTPDFAGLTGIFTPLVYVEVESSDTACVPGEKVEVRGESYLAKRLDGGGNVRHLVREGRHTVLNAHGIVLARVRLVNAFTRLGSDAARRHVTELPPGLGLGPGPSRVTEVPDIDTLVPRNRAPEFAEAATHVWHYGQTDPNRHVTGMAYLRLMEGYSANVLHDRGHDLKRLFPARARIVYRKPCFRGERYRRVAWFGGETPLILTGAFMKAADGPEARPAAVVELCFLQHDSAEGG